MAELALMLCHGMLRLVDGVWQRAQISGGGGGAGASDCGDGTGGVSGIHVRYDEIEAEGNINGSASVCTMEADFVVM